VRAGLDAHQAWGQFVARCSIARGAARADADAITVLADDPVGLVGREERECDHHAARRRDGTAHRSSVEEVQASHRRRDRFCTTHRVYVVLKDTGRSSPRGRHVFINPTGNAEWRPAAPATC